MSQSISKLRVVCLLVVRTFQMFCLDFLHGREGTLVRQHLLDNTYLGNDWLVFTQTDIQVEDATHQHQYQYAHPEQTAPFTPQERIVLHGLGRIELIGMKRVDIDGHYLQCQLVGLIGLSIHLYLHAGSMISTPGTR